MGYQALLFCPDEKLARVAGQVFSELDFTVEPVHEPFDAVKKLMAQRYDAIVVDCENEQNASLLFKSAKNSSSNQNSLAIALVEGQAGVAKAYRIGANLLLTKPINVEQAKGTLRVARGLLRKNSDAAGASAASAATPAMPAKPAPVSAGSSLQPASRGVAVTAPPASRPEIPESEAPLPAAIPAAIPVELPAMAASAKVEDKPAVVPAPTAQTPIAIAAGPAVEARQPISAGVVKNDVVKNDVVKNDVVKSDPARIAAASVPSQNRSSAFTPAPGSAAAAAPAKEVTAPPAKENKTVELEPAKPSSDKPSPDKLSPTQASHDAVPESVPTLSSVGLTNAPSFAALGEEDSGGSGGSKKVLIAAVAVVALAALGYLGYGKLNKSSTTPAPQAVSTPENSGQPAPSTSTAGRASSTTQTVAPKTAAATTPDKPSADAGNSPVIRTAANPEPGTKKPDSAPILVKSSAARTKTQAEESAPPLPSTLAVAPESDSNLEGLMSSASSSVPKPSLATLRISQGVSQGLLIKRVQPKYPSNALAVHAQGAVQVEATINKEGNVTNLKVLSGDSILARAAVEAVRQWRYKPYYLNGEPVEIQTQITINFKAN
ncbi:MAG: TonB family protein [Terriglobales bacterium]|jgi:protein TonB